jgi:hypothetical protein
MSVQDVVNNGMQEILDTLLMYLSRPFVQYALIVGVLIALCSSLLGVSLVLKRFSFVGDGLSHVAFGAMCVAQVIGLSKNMFIIMPVTIIAAVLLLRFGQNTKVKGDAAIAMVSVAALAFGYLIINLFSNSGNVAVTSALLCLAPPLSSPLNLKKYGPALVYPSSSSFSSSFSITESSRLPSMKASQEPLERKPIFTISPSLLSLQSSSFWR